MKKIILLLLLLCTFLNAQNKTNYGSNREQKIKRLMKLQDERDVLEAGKYLKDNDIKVVRQALLALANIQDTIAAPLISDLSAKQNEEGRIPFVVTLGLLGPSSVTASYLYNELKHAENTELRALAFESLGRTGAPNYLDSILLIKPLNPTDEAAKLMGIARFALRGIRSGDAMSYIVGQLKSIDRIVRNNASFAFWRSANPQLLQDHLPQILSILAASQSESDYYIINGLASAPPDTSIKKFLISCLARDSKIVLSSIKILEKHPVTKSEIDVIVESANSQDEHVRLALYRYLPKAALVDSSNKQYVLEKIGVFLTNTNLNWREKSELLIGLAAIRGGAMLPELIKESGSNNDRYNAKLIRAISEINSGEALDAILNKVNASSALANMAQLEAIAKLRTKVTLDSLQMKRIKFILVSSLNSNNPAVVTTAVIAINNNQFRNLIPFSEYVKVYNKLKLPDDVEGMLEFIKLFTLIGNPEAIKVLESAVNSPSDAVSKLAIDNLYDLTGKDYFRTSGEQGKVKSSYYDWKYYEKMVKAPLIIEISTEKGKIKVQLYPYEAPFTCMSMCKLIDKKFYDGLVFHRVVSNFVIQGGDPMGTGWGGPGYSIRTELSAAKFVTGALGMASAGKDTEGSQFFITHSPQPHLDGRYTVFGKVIEGMDVVDKIQEGDKIISIRRAK